MKPQEVEERTGLLCIQLKMYVNKGEKSIFYSLHEIPNNVCIVQADILKMFTKRQFTEILDPDLMVRSFNELGGIT